MEEHKDRISISLCRKVLGKKFETCTDQEVMDIRDWLYKMAKINIKIINDKGLLNHPELLNQVKPTRIRTQKE